MTALLTNPSGAEIQFKWRWGGENCYMNNLFVPDTSQTEWERDELYEQLQVEIIPALLAATHEEAELESVKIRSRGNSEAGQTTTFGINDFGTLTGTPMPAWVTWNLFQLPDNDNKLIVTGTPSDFRNGRINLPGVVAEDQRFGSPVGAAVSYLAGVASVIGNIPVLAVDPNNPAFSLVMVRHVAGVLVQKANITSVIIGKVGTQLTRRS